jgi:hypothetical protein
MYRLFLGLNVWNVLLLSAALVLGWVRSPLHVRGGILAAVFCCLVQSGMVALFIGAAKLIKEHVGRFNMPLSLIDRLNAVYHKLLFLGATATTLMAAVAILGGVADTGQVPLPVHLGLALLAFGFVAAAVPLEHRLLKRLNGIVTDVERLLPAPEAAAPAPGYSPDKVVLDARGRARALCYLGLTLPLPYLGYTFISGRNVSFLLIPTVVATLLCLLASAHQFRAARRAGGPFTDSSQPLR